LHDAGSPQPINFFADGVISTASNATQMVDRLQNEGFVQRTRNPQDRRSVLVQLTPLGKERLARGHARRQQLAQALFAPMSVQERANALQTLRQLLLLLEDFQREHQEPLRPDSGKAQATPHPDRSSVHMQGGPS